jgi:hypothetical protein
MVLQKEHGVENGDVEGRLAGCFREQQHDEIVEI